jgi:hypothetical protein
VQAAAVPHLVLVNPKLRACARFGDRPGRGALISGRSEVGRIRLSPLSSPSAEPVRVGTVWRAPIPPMRWKPRRKRSGLNGPARGPGAAVRRRGVEPPRTASEHAPAPARSLTDRSFSRILAGIVVVSALLRLVLLGTYPERFNQDAMVLGYDAWSVWLTGRDHHGALLPIHFRTFDDYVPPTSNYMAAPFVGIFGLSEAVVRLPFALGGIVTVALTGLLGRRWLGPAAGLVAALLLAVEPWHVNYSRIAHPGSSVPLFTVLALYCFTRGCGSLAQARAQAQVRGDGAGVAGPAGSRREAAAPYGWLVASAVAFALLCGTYPPLKLQTPLLIGACLLGLLAAGPRGDRRGLGAPVAAFLATFAVLVAPLLVSQLRNWDSVQARFAGLSIFEGPHPLAQFMSNYAEHFNPGPLFFRGLDDALGVLPPGFGELFWLEWPLVCVGAVALATAARERPSAGLSVAALAFAWALTFPIASSLTNTSGAAHEIRAYNVLPLPELLAGAGAVAAWDTLKRIGPGLGSPAPLAAAGAGVALIVFTVLFVAGYFAPTARTSDPVGPDPYNVGLRDALAFAGGRAGDCDTVYLEPDNQAYVSYLFLTRFPPREFQAARQPALAPLAVFESAGRARFSVPAPDAPAEGRPRACATSPSTNFFVTRTPPGDPAWSRLATLPDDAGHPAWHVMAADAAPAAGRAD